MMNFRKTIQCALAAAVLSASGAHANILTNSGFEDNTLHNLLGVQNQWGGEHNSSIVTAEFGVTPNEGSQMLSIGDAGGGSAAQVAQEVTGTFLAGSTVTFDVDLNAAAAGAVSYITLAFDGWGANQVQASLALDADASTWETLTLSTVINVDYTSIFAQIWTPIVSGGAQGHYVEYPNQYLYADNTSLTVTPLEVPAPAVASLMLLGLAGLFVGRKSRRQA